MQPDFDFSAPIAPSSSRLARHTSAMGALDANERIGRQCLRLLTLYRERGPMADWEAADLLCLYRSTINARRNNLIARGLVQAIDTAKNPKTGISNTRWGLATT